MMVTPEPAPSERSRPIAMAFMIWEGTFGSGVKTGPMPAGTAGFFGALPGSTNILMIFFCRIAATICPPVAGITTDFGACWDNGSRFTVHSSRFTVRIPTVPISPRCPIGPIPKAVFPNCANEILLRFPTANCKQ
jgi:hypothetical protein